jgi:uncharacterized damage-inducible protein DinB
VAFGSIKFKLTTKTEPMLSKHVKSFFERNHFVVTGNLTDISHEESLQTSTNGSSSINWVLGHIVRYRLRTLKLLGHPRPDEEVYKALYDYNTVPNGEIALPIEQLKLLYEDTQKQLTDLIDKLDEGLDTEDKIVFMAYHETMHSGQLGILRRILGKDPGVKYGG